MTAKQVEEAETIVNNMADKNDVVYAKDTSLAVAKTIQGLRAVFDEVYPDPVRIVSVGIPVEDLVNDPMGPGGSTTTVEFCGGTHLLRSGHVGRFAIVSEDAISKGIRRIVAISGSEAAKALHKTQVLDDSVKSLTNKIEKNATSREHTDKQLTREIVELDDEVAQAVIPYWRKDELRGKLKGLKKTMDDLDKARKATVMNEVIEEAKKMIDSCPNKPVVIHEFKAGSNAKALDAAMKQYKSLSPETAAMFFSVDPEQGKILCMSCVPKSTITKGLKANEWVGHLTSVLNGKGGGKDASAQATGTNTEGLGEAIKLATQFAELKLT